MSRIPGNIPFVDAQGIGLVQAREGQAELSLVLRPDQANHLGMAHGGVIMTLLDVAMAQAARAYEGSLYVITIEMKTTFFQAARGTLRARGQTLHRSRRMAFCEATVFDEEGRRCAHATGTFRYVDPQAVRSAAPETPGATS